jgi:hypothetical protein
MLITKACSDYENDITFEQLQKLTINDIEKVYIGQRDGCRCGCLGDYHINDDEGKYFKRTLSKLSTAIAKEDVHVYTDANLCDGYIEIWVPGSEKCTGIYLMPGALKK